MCPTCQTCSLNSSLKYTTDLSVAIVGFTGRYFLPQILFKIEVMCLCVAYLAGGRESACFQDKT